MERGIASFVQKKGDIVIPIDQFNKWEYIIIEYAQTYLNQQEIKEYDLISKNDKKEQLKDLLERPIANFTLVNDVYFRARWFEVLRMINPNSKINLLEIASGDADMIPQAMARSHPNSFYFSSNMNKILTERLIERTKDLPLNIKIIEDDAIHINNYLAGESIDIIAFQHSINDILQAMLCSKYGIDTIHNDWMEILPIMIDILQKEICQNTLEQHVKIPFLSLLGELWKVLKKNGIVVMNHYMFQLDLDLGYPSDLFENMVPMVREWIKDLLGYKEIFIDGFDKQWWLFLKKDQT